MNSIGPQEIAELAERDFSCSVAHIAFIARHSPRAFAVIRQDVQSSFDELHRILTTTGNVLAFPPPVARLVTEQRG